MMKHTERRELYCGLLLILIGVGIAAGSFEYKVGTLARMGPGYFPLVVGILLVLVGGLIMATPPSPLERGQEGPPVTRGQLRSWGLILAGIVAFIVLGRYAGLVPATFGLMFLSALGDRATSARAAAVLAAAVTVAAALVFHYGLQMQFPLFRWG